jgi:hypothetical protein
VQRWIGGGERREVVLAMGGGAPVLRQGRKVAVVVRDEMGNSVGLLIAGVRRFVGRYFEVEKLPQPAMAVREKSRCGLRPAEFAANQALLDATRRAGGRAGRGSGDAEFGRQWRWCWRGRLGRAFMAAAVVGRQGGSRRH